MYNLKNVVEKITREEILNRVTEYDIFTYYAGKNVKIGSIVSSPLRDDKHPSFGIYKSQNGNGLMFKDLATNISGDCFKLVQLLFSITYKESLKRIWCDMITKGLTKSKEGIRIDKHEVYSKKSILIRRRNFSEIDDEYWSKYLISRDLLKDYNVFPIESFWVNGIQSKLTYTKNCPMYAYKVFNSFKIYRPLSKNREDKWRSNCTKFDIQGWEQLPDRGDLLVITKSLKDIMVLKRFNILSIAPHSEVSLLPESVLNEAQNRFKHILVLFDNDDAGRKGANELKEKYNLETIEIPRHYLDIYGVKDISDFIREFGEEKTKELIKEMI